MHLRVHNHLTDLVSATREEREWLEHYVGYWEVGFYKDRYTGRAKRGKPRRVSLLQKNQFPSGLVRLAAKAAKTEGYDVSFEDVRIVPNTQPDPDADISFLKDHQSPAIPRILERKRGIISIPTGGGKTALAVAASMAWPLRWLFLVGQKDLLSQTAKEYKRFSGKDPNIIGDGRFDIVDERSFTVAMKQTLSGRSEVPEVWDFVTKAEGVILDEVHGGAAATDQRILLATERAYCRIGMSGTPWGRSDLKNILILGVFGPTIYKLTVPELVESGAIVPLLIYMTPLYQESERVTWDGVYNDLVMKSTARNKLITKLLVNAAKPAICFVRKVPHGKELTKRAIRAGLQAEFVWGDVSTEGRKASFERLTRRDLDVVVCSPAFYQGIDVPSLRSIVIGTGGKSVIETLQRIGRGTRLAPGKTHCDVYDVLDEGNRWMEKHARARLRAYEQAGHQVKTSSSSTENDAPTT